MEKRQILFNGKTLIKKDQQIHNDSNRILFLDNFKLFLIILVVAHHSCQAFIPDGGWMIKDKLNTTYWLFNFVCVNMTFFMGAFFFVSGYFVPKSLEKRKISEYIARKAKRLLVPVVILVVCIVPAYFYFAYLGQAENPVGFFTFYINNYWKQGLVSYDHGWFMLSLFLYSVIYLLIHKLCEKIQFRLTCWRIVFFIILMSLLTFLVRIFFSIDQWVLVFGFIGFEPAHLPQYFLWFLAGTMTRKNKWLEQITPWMGRSCLAVGLFLSTLIYLRQILPQSLVAALYAVFALFESTMSVTIVIGLIYIFRRYFDKQMGILHNLCENAFTIYIIHNFFVVLFQYLICQIRINATVKFLLTTIAAFLCAWITAMIISKIAGIFLQR